MDKYATAYQQGYNAFQNACAKGNPYTDNEALRNCWLNGYLDAEFDIATGNY